MPHVPPIRTNLARSRKNRRQLQEALIKGRLTAPEAKEPSTEGIFDEAVKKLCACTTSGDRAIEWLFLVREHGLEFANLAAEEAESKRNPTA